MSIVRRKVDEQVYQNIDRTLPGMLEAFSKYQVLP